LATYLPEFGISVSVYNPGVIATKFSEAVTEKYDITSIPEAYLPYVGKLRNLMEIIFSSDEGAPQRSTPDESASEVVAIVESDKPDVRIVPAKVQGLVSLKLADLTGNTARDAVRSMLFQ